MQVKKNELFYDVSGFKTYYSSLPSEKKKYIRAKIMAQVWPDRNRSVFYNTLIYGVSPTYKLTAESVARVINEFDASITREQLFPNHDFSDTMSNNIAKILHRKNMSQVQLAKETGISTQLIAIYVAEKSEPGLKNAFLIADALRTDIKEIFPFLKQAS